MSNAVYKKALQSFLSAGINMLTDTIKAALVTSAYTPDLTNDQFFSAISANVVGTPQVITGPSVTNGVFNGGNVTFPAVPAGSTVSHLVIYKDTGTAGTSPLICQVDTATGLPITTNGGDITIAWDTGANHIMAL